MKINFKLPLTVVIRYVKIAIAVLMTAGLVLTVYFLYENLYKPLTQAVIVAELKTKVALITVNTKDLNELLANIEKNKNLPALDWASIPDPFNINHQLLPLPTPATNQQDTASSIKALP